jgi:hypothetical protein
LANVLTLVTVTRTRHKTIGQILATDDVKPSVACLNLDPMKPANHHVAIFHVHPLRVMLVSVM